MLQPPHTDPRPGRRIPLLSCVAALFLSTLPGCAPRSDGPPLEDFNILMIVVDTLSAKHVGIYDPALDHTPRLDAFAGSNTRFDRAYSTSPWTQPSVASIFTARTPSGHGVHNIRDVLGTEQVTLAELLHERGYATHGVISHHLIGSELGYDQGFDSYDESAVEGHTGVSSGKVTDLAIGHLDTHRDSRFFLFVHYFDPHYYYHHHPQFDRTSAYAGPLADVDDVWTVREMRPSLRDTDIEFLRGRHLEEIALVDQHVGRLLDHLSRSGLDDSTIVVFVSDHGEELMDHGWIGHTRTLYEELIHVPMILKIPGITSPVVVTDPVTILDILPTLLSLSAKPVDGRDWDGRSLMPYLSGRKRWPADREIFAEVSFLPPSIRQAQKLAFKTALVQGDLKIVHDRVADSWELYRLSADPAEQEDLARENPSDLERLAGRLGAWERTRDLPTRFTMPAPEGVTEEELERLRGLGYVQ